MNEYLPEQYYGYYPAEQYQPLFWQGLVGGLINLVMLVAMSAWAFSLVKKAIKGEPVEFPEPPRFGREEMR
jgi:hypothetical protein